MLDFYIGRARSGKTARLYEKIQKNERAEEQSILIVPPRFTHETERALLKYLSGGMLHTVVCSFESLSKRILEEAGERRVFLSKQGRFMLIRRAIEKLSLKYFPAASHRAGFVEKLDKLLSNFEYSQITPEQIMEAADDPKLSADLKTKLIETYHVYKYMNEYMNARSISSNDSHNAVIEYIPSSELCRSHVFIDGIDSPTEQNYALINALLDTAKSITVSVRSDISDDVRECDMSLFAPEVDFYDRVREMAEKKGLIIRNNPEGFVPDHSPERYGAPELYFLERELFSYSSDTFKGTADAIEIFTASDRFHEVAAVTERVLDAVKNHGCRFRDIAVIAADEDQYGPLIRNEFKKANIPMFSDIKRRLDSTPVARLILSALRAVSGGYSIRYISELIKTELTGLTRDEAELLENYMIENGVYGSELKKPFERGDIPDLVENARKKLIEPLLTLQEEFSRGDVNTKTDALYHYLDALNIDEQLQKTTSDLKLAGRHERARTYAQIYNAIVELLSQLTTILSGVPMSSERYIAILEEGLGAVQVSIIPPGIDMVLFGSVAHTITPTIKRVYVIGSCEGSFPKDQEDTGIIDDSDLIKLKGAGLNVWQNSDKQAQIDRLQIYSLLTLASEKLFISYPANADKEEKQPSSAVERLRAIFPNTHKTMIAPAQHSELDTLAAALREYTFTGEMDDDSKKLLARCIKKYEAFQGVNTEEAVRYRSGFEALERALFYDPSPNDLDPDFVLKLYSHGRGDERSISGSVTRFESFNSCPFRHFANYGLSVRERREFTEQRTDTGSLCHDALDAFVTYILNNKMDYKSFDRADSDGVVDKIIDDVFARYKFDTLLETDRGRRRRAYYEAVIKDSAYAIIWQMQQNDFDFLQSEIEFRQGESEGEKPIYPPFEIELADGIKCRINGKIDRVDVLHDESTGQDMLRIIDYKVSKKKREVDIAMLESGISIQLPLYMAATDALGISGDGTTLGGYYMPVHETPTLKASEAEDGDIEKKIIASYKPSGFSLEDERIYPGEPEESDVKILDKAELKDNSALPEAHLTGMKLLAVQAAKRAAEAIASGVVSVSPYEYRNGSKVKAPCKYCEYKSFCQIDKRFSGCEPRIIRPTTLRKVFTPKKSEQE